MTIRPTIDEIKDLILKKYSTKDFTPSDILYEFCEKYNLSIFGTVRNLLVNLSKSGFLKYNMVLRPISKNNSQILRKGVIYHLNR